MYIYLTLAMPDINFHFSPCIFPYQVTNCETNFSVHQQELEKKVSQTNPFKNLKKMLMKKNEQLKDLRKRLSK